MYYSLNEKAIKDTLGMLCDVKKPVKLNEDNMSKVYDEFLIKESVFERKIIPREMEIMNFETLFFIAPKFCNEKNEFFKKNSSLLESRIKNGFFHSALEDFRSQHKELYELSKFIIKAILVNHLQSYTNGTTERTIGLASMDFKDFFDSQDFVELCVHQLTHMLLFIDDRNHGHMKSCSKETLIETHVIKFALGGTAFPAYLMFHSYLVGVEILCFRNDTKGLLFKGNYHGETGRIIKVCQEFHNALKKNLNLFEDRAKLILENAFSIFERICFQYKRTMLV